MTVFYQKNKTWLDEVLKPMVVSVSGKNPTVDEYKPGQYGLPIYSKRFYHLLKDVYGFPVNGRGQTHWEITPTLRATEPETLIPFIRGFFDAEGDVTVNRRSPYIGFSQKNACVLTCERNIC
ncbi:MAG: LAGLIDADG family homing endonuclease [Candidatus Caldarchaeum sp.]